MKISEDFYSVQGEGISQGVPSYFVRLQGCNLICGGPCGRLKDEGKATWYCDTEPVWRQGMEVSNEELVGKIQDTGQFENVLSGDTHIVWTGGEPTLPKHQKDIVGFLDHLHQKDWKIKPYSEIETNGTQILDSDLLKSVQQLNVSPKLANSGMKGSLRIVPEAINSALQHENSWFKFVVTDESDIEEFERYFTIPYEIPRNRVIIMPGCDNLDGLPVATRKCYELSMKHGYRTISRGHILAWNKKTGI